MPKPKSPVRLGALQQKTELHTWTQRAPLSLINAALTVAGKDDKSVALGLNRLTRLVNYLLREYAKGGKS
jgi:hypothetical protein